MRITLCVVDKATKLGACVLFAVLREMHATVPHMPCHERSWLERVHSHRCDAVHAQWLAPQEASCWCQGRPVFIIGSLASCH